tara:strand:+ start:404 stop:1858 length:1455 start_codon:yes stop_codon:yes gene_type:complete
MKINRVFDIIGPMGPVPNGLNWKFTNTFWDYNFHVTHKLIDAFNKSYTQLSVYDCNLNLPQDIIKNYHITDLHFDEESKLITNKEENYFYTIHPFGNIHISTGLDMSYHEGMHSFDFISKKTKTYSEASNFWLIYDYSSEGDINEHIFESLHLACKRNNINPSKVIVITASENTFDIYKRYLDKAPQDKLLYTAFYPWSLLGKAKDTQSIMFEKKIIDFNGHKNKNSIMLDDEFDNLTQRESYALCLNRRLAPHRLILISWLLENKLFDKTKTSYDIKLLHRDDAGLDLVSGSGHDGDGYLESQSSKNEIMSGFRKMVKKEKSIIDFEDIENVWGFAFENSENYKSTYFSIVTETLFYELGNYLSEKTWKPIAHLHPFILIGRPGMLKFLHSLGFKTFSEFWDESYDTIEMNSTRMEKIFEVIKTLLSKSKDEWDELNKKLKPILIFNRNLLLTFQEEKVGNTYKNKLFNLIQNEPNQENYYLL